MEKRTDGETRAVYVRPIAVIDLPPEVQAELIDCETVYAICDDEGTQLALVSGKELAYTVARHNDYEPHAVN